MKKYLLTLFILFSGVYMFSQTTVSGVVVDSNTQNPLPGVNVKVTGKNTGSSTDFNGKFSFTVNEEPPFTLEFTFVGYARQTKEITSNNQELSIALVESQTSLDEVVVSA